MSGEPFSQERALTKTGGGTKEDQSAVQTLVEAFDLARAEDDIRQRWGDMGFSGKNRRRHRSILEHTSVAP